MTVLDTCAPLRPSASPAPLGGGVLAAARRISGPLARIIEPAWWLGAAALTTAVVRLVGGGDAAFLAVGATACLVYGGTAVISGRVSLVLIDLAAALLVLGLVASVVGPAGAFAAHALWGAFRMSVDSAGPGRRFVTAWSVFFAASAVFAGLGI